MAGVNKVILVGRLGKDPETKSFANGGSVTQFTMATSENWRDKQSGERKERTEWHNIVIRNDSNFFRPKGPFVRIAWPIGLGILFFLPFHIFSF